MHILSKLAIAQTEFNSQHSSNDIPKIAAISYDDAKELLAELSRHVLCGFDPECESILIRGDREEIINKVQQITMRGMKIVVADITTIGADK
jgi:hypothetical protein